VISTYLQRVRGAADVDPAADPSPQCEGESLLTAHRKQA
jgi:hypothetical protein